MGAVSVLLNTVFLPPAHSRCSTKSLLTELNYSPAPPGIKGITWVPAVSGFGRSVRLFLADSQGFHRFMATDLEHEDIAETAAFGAENNLIVTGSRDALIQVRGKPRAVILTSASRI